MRERYTDGGLRGPTGPAAAVLVVSLALFSGCGDPGGSAPAATTGTGETEAEGVDPPGEGHGRQRILDQARRRGARFWGSGNEPGWNVEIGTARTTFVTGYGAERYRFDTPRPVVDESKGTTSYRTRFDDSEIVIEFRRETCDDTMSDETFPLRVRVALDGRELRGCGVALGEAGR